MDTIKCDSTHLFTVYDRKTSKNRVLDFKTIQKMGADRFLIPGAGGKWYKIGKASKAQNFNEVRCIKVDNSTHLYVTGREGKLILHNTGGGKSVLQRNVVAHCIAHAREIKFIGIDLKKVELSSYKKYSNAVIAVATTLEDALEVLRFAQDTMMDRYSEMEQVGVQNFLDMQNAGSALLVMIDEAGELLDTSAPAKALASSTPLDTAEDRGTIGEVRVGDHVKGTDNQWHEVLDKYEPSDQSRYELSITRSSDGSNETIVAGAEHLWRVWMPVRLMDLLPESAIDVVQHGDGTVTAVITTESIMELSNTLTDDDFKQVRLRRDAVSSE